MSTSVRPEHGPGSANAERLYAEFQGDFREAFPGEFSSVDAITFAKARPGSAMYAALIEHGGATDAERVLNFEILMADVFDKPDPLHGRS
jgi:hypothetical protein